LTLFTSVTTGVPISGQSRLNANAKSPVSQGIGDSQSGGFFPAELKFAGFDGIVIRGRSPEPVYLSILDGQPTIHAADHLAGKETAEVEKILRLETGEPKAEFCSTAWQPRTACFSAWSQWQTATTGARHGLVMAAESEGDRCREKSTRSPISGIDSAE
jgi:aldehyde:ferredoxin oxidoreductase